MSEEWVCENCGRKFKSKRGLSVHLRYCNKKGEKNKETSEEIYEETKKEEAEKIDLEEAISTAVNSTLNAVLPSLMETFLSRVEEVENRVLDTLSIQQSHPQESEKDIQQQPQIMEVISQKEDDEGEVIAESQTYVDMPEPSEEREEDVFTDIPVNTDEIDELRRNVEAISEELKQIRERIDELDVRADVENRFTLVENEISDLHGSLIEIEAIKDSVQHLKESVDHLRMVLKETLESYEFFDLGKIPPQILKNVYEATLNDIYNHLWGSVGERDAQDIVRTVLEEVRKKTTGSELFRFDGRRFFTDSLVESIEHGHLTVKVIHMTYEEILKKLMEYLPTYRKRDFQNIIRVKSQEYAIATANENRMIIERLMKENLNLVNIIDELNERLMLVEDRMELLERKLSDFREEIKEDLKTFVEILIEEKLSSMNIQVSTPIESEEQQSGKDTKDVQRDEIPGEDKTNGDKESQLDEDKAEFDEEVEVHDNLASGEVVEERAEVSEDDISFPEGGVFELGDEEETEDIESTKEDELDIKIEDGIFEIGDSDEDSDNMEEEDEGIDAVDGIFYVEGEDDSEIEEDDGEVNVIVRDGAVEIISEEEHSEREGDVKVIEKDGMIVIVEDEEESVDKEEPEDTIDTNSEVESDEKKKTARRKRGKQKKKQPLAEVEDVILGILMANMGEWISRRRIISTVKSNIEVDTGVIDTVIEKLLHEEKIECEGESKRSMRYRISMER